MFYPFASAQSVIPTFLQESRFLHPSIPFFQDTTTEQCEEKSNHLIPDWPKPPSSETLTRSTPRFLVVCAQNQYDPTDCQKEKLSET